MFSRILGYVLKKSELRNNYTHQQLISNPAYSTGKIAIARDFAVILQDNGWELKLLGHNPNFRQLCMTADRRYIKLAAGFDGYMALTDDGHIMTGPKAKEFERGIEIERLCNVIDVVGCEGHTVALHHDGRVSCVDEPEGYDGPDNYAREVESWHGIIQVACGYNFIAGLKSDGTLISVGQYYRCPNWKGVVQFDAFNCYYGNCYTIALLDNGVVIADYTNEVNKWRNVKRVRVGNNGYTIGLKEDGTAYALGNDNFVREVESWYNIVEIECKFNNAVAILKDGTIKSIGF